MALHDSDLGELEATCPTPLWPKGVHKRAVYAFVCPQHGTVPVVTGAITMHLQ
jgi:hypothetical protein